MRDLNVADVESYFNWIDRSETIFSCAVLDGESRRAVEAGITHNSSHKLIELIQRLGSVVIPGPTLHVTLNRTDRLGIRKQNIESCRVLCVDLDCVVPRGTLRDWISEYSVGQVVESSEGRFHLYWRLAEGMSFSSWSAWQLAFASRLGGDMSLSQIGHMVRVPGIGRTCKDGSRFVPSVVWQDPEAAYWSEGELGERFPWMGDALTAARGKLDAARKETLLALRAARKAGLSIGRGIGVTLGEVMPGRNNQLFCAVYAACGADSSLELEEAQQIGEAVNAGFGVGLDEAEVARTVESAWERSRWVRSEYRDAMLGKERESMDKLLGVVGDDWQGFGVNGAECSAPVEPQPVSGGVGSGGDAFGRFLYDYSTVPFRTNRFSDIAVVERIKQRFKNNLIRVGGVLYAFSNETLTWIPQAVGSGRDVLQTIIKTCLIDTLWDSQFNGIFCIDREGNFSPRMREKAERDWISESKVGAILRLLVNEFEASAPMSVFDRNPEVLGISNGALALSGTIEDLRAEHMLLRRSSVVWTAEAGCPGWEKFVSEIFAGNESCAEMESFIQELFGYSLSGLMSVQKVFIHYGTGSNGKSKLLEALAMLGGDYATRLDSSKLMKMKGSSGVELSRIGAKIEGKRIAILEDLDTEGSWNDAFIKNLTAPRMICRKLYHEEVDVPNRTKFHLACNSQPRPEGTDFGIFRRMCMIPYLFHFLPDAEKELELTEMLRVEQSGILNWALDGYARFKQRGNFKYPEECELDMEEYRSEYSGVEQVIRDLFEINPQREAGVGDEVYWHSGAFLAGLVNARLGAISGSKKVTVQGLGMVLKTHFRCNVVRSKVSGKKIRVYNVLIKK